MTPDERFIQWLKIAIATGALIYFLVWSHDIYEMLLAILKAVQK